jgi:P-loop Domain of unknown function (DUF2791)
MTMDLQIDESNFDLTSAIGNGYAKYYLLGDPFPAFTITEEAPKLFVDRVTLMHDIQRYILDLHSSGDSDAFLILGDYGTGKTHILKFLKHQINSSLANLENDRALAIYVRPGGSMLDFLANFVSSLGLDFLTVTVKDYIDNLGASPTRTAAKAPVPLFGDTSFLKKGLQSRVDFVRAHAGNVLLQAVGSSDLLSVIAAFYDPKSRIAAWSWLRGMPITAQDRKEMQIAATIKEEGVLPILNGLIQFLHASRYKTIFILFDELEEVAELSDEAHRYVYLSRLRQLIDDNHRGMGIIFTVTDAGWDQIRAASEPLVRRIEQERQHVLEPFDVDTAKRLVENYLIVGREGYCRSTKSTAEQIEHNIRKDVPSIADPSLFPFSSEIIETIVRRSHGRVGSILRDLKILIKMGYREGKFYNQRDDIATVLGSVE